MNKHKFTYRPGLCAIAAFAALGATPLMAQTADPLVSSSDPAPVVSSEPIVVAPDPVAVPVDPLAPAAKTSVATKKSAARINRSPTRTTTATRTPTRVSARSAAPVAAVPTIVAAPAPAPLTVAQPVADVAPLPPEAPVAAAPAPAPVIDNGLPADALPIGAAGLGALALAGAALALRRRKRRLAEDEFVTHYDEPAFVAEAPVAPMMAEPTPAVVEKPVMEWGTTTAAVAAPANVAAATEGDGEVPEGVDPTSHVAAAYRGPSDENPSLSLKTRLKRGAFFDQRERQVAAGEAAPLDMTAGLPDAMIDEISDTPNAAASNSVAPPLSTGGSYSLRPSPEHA